MLKGNKIGDKVFDIINVGFMLVLILLTLYPFLYLVSMSFSGSHAVMAQKVAIWPVDFTLAAYARIVGNMDFWISYRNTIIYVVAGTIVQLVATTLLAYPLSKNRLMFRSAISYFAAFTMYFGGGLVPWFILLTMLGLRNNMWAMIIPGALSVYNAIILRTYFQNSIPIEMEESAMIDGMGNVGILTYIYVPLSKPIYATLFLFITVGIWNSYFSALLLLNNKALYPLQMFLRNLISSGVIQQAGAVAQEGPGTTTVPDTLKGAAMVLSMLPIMMVYPFIQKHFVKGVLVGSIKG